MEPINWQPIETAPKDGTQLLFWTVHDTVEVGEWFQITSFHYEVAGDNLYRRVPHTYGNSWNTQSQPTHWAPLPPGPNGQTAKRLADLSEQESDNG